MRQIISSLLICKLLIGQNSYTVPGFFQILSSNYHVVGVEAKLSDLMKCEVWEEIPPDKQDALKIYTTLKESSRRSGNTFMDFKRLPTHPKLKGKLQEFTEAIGYLQKHNVIVLEKPPNVGKERIFLERLWSSEKRIAEGLVCLLMDHQEKPYSVQADIDRYA